VVEIVGLCSGVGLGIEGIHVEHIGLQLREIPCLQRRDVILLLLQRRDIILL